MVRGGKRSRYLRPLRAGRQGLTPAPSVKDAKWRGRHFADFLLEKIYAAPARCDEFRVRRYQTSQNGVRAILRVQGRALPPTAEVI